MYRFSLGILGGAIAVFAMGVIIPDADSGLGAGLRASTRTIGLHGQTHGQTYVSVNRTLKGDRLSACTSGLRSNGSPVCQERLRGAAARPANVITVQKTMRRLPMGNVVDSPVRRPGGQRRDPLPAIAMPIGCEAAVSVAADPELASTPSRCIS